MVALSGFNPVTFYDFVVNLKMDFSLILFQAFYGFPGRLSLEIA
ncbi:MAG: hypothetical protein CM1200mP41_17820 [Gammaproteobacteria bacterium]|nr:MAG: hypothetical protein CM1200mP41_17820 [Gammaproteobacteria bacterium]